MRDKFLNSSISVTTLTSTPTFQINEMVDKIINGLTPDEVLKEWLDWEGIIGYDTQIKRAIEAIYQISLKGEKINKFNQTR